MSCGKPWMMMAMAAGRCSKGKNCLRIHLVFQICWKYREIFLASYGSPLYCPYRVYIYIHIYTCKYIYIYIIMIYTYNIYIYAVYKHIYIQRLNVHSTFQSIHIIRRSVQFRLWNVFFLALLYTYIDI